MTDDVVPRRIVVTVLAAGLFVTAAAAPARAAGEESPEVTNGPCQYTPRRPTA